MPRKLERIYLDLTQLGEQGKIRGFLSNVGNADQLGGLLEDIRDAMMEYQVCTIHRASHYCSIQCSNQTSLQQDIYDKSCGLIVGHIPSSLIRVD